MYSTRRYRPSSLKEAYLESYRWREQPERYRQPSAAANQRMRSYCAGDVVRQRLEPFLSARKATPAPGVELAATAAGNVPC